MRLEYGTATGAPIALPLPLPPRGGNARPLDVRAVSAWLPDGSGSQTLSWLFKRLLDVVLATGLLLLLSPVVLLAMVAVRLTSPGPVIFRQRRVGYRGRPFTMYKLRTMVDGAAALEGRLAGQGDGRIFFKLRDDPRLTSVGRILRRTSIDELPQLVNVLLGDMSLVGPRPLLVSDLRGFPQSDHRLRFAMVPGITGLWQVSGRSECSESERVRLDTDYVERWSLALDLRILLRTVPAVVRARGAV